MSFGNTPTTTTQGALGTNQIPLGSVAEPGRANGDLTTLEGGPGSVDSNGNRTAPVSTYAKDGNDVTQGTSTDANTANTVMGRLTKVRDLLLSVLSFNLVDSAGTNKASVSAGGAVKVDNSAVTQPISATSLPLPTGAAIEAGHLATIDTSTAASKTDLDTIVTNTNKIPASPATEGGNLATLAGGVTSSKYQSNVAQINGVAPTMGNGIAGTGVQRVSIASDSTGQVTANAGTNLNTSLLALESGGNLATLAGAIAAAIMQANVKQINGITPLMGNGVTGTGSQRVTIASDNTAFSTNAVQSGTWTVQPGNTANTTPWMVQEQAGTAGGSTPYHLLSAANNNATSLKASAGNVYGFSFSNTNASDRWVKFYNKASAPAPATDTVAWAEKVPGNGVIIATIPEGMSFTTGIAFAAVVNASDTDNTSVGAGDLSIDIRYK